MTNKKSSPDWNEKWHAVSCAIEADEIASITDPALLEAYIDEEIAALDEVTARRMDRSIKKLEGRLKGIVAKERAKLAPLSRGLRAAADNGGMQQSTPPVAIRPLDFQFLIDEVSYIVGVTVEPPNDIVLIGVVPPDRMRLRIGGQLFALIATPRRATYRVRGLSEAQLKQLLAKPGTQLQFVKA